MKLYKSIILIFSVLFFNLDLLAQQSPGIVYSEHFQAQRAAFQPSFLGSTGDKFEIGIIPVNLLNAHVWGGSADVGFNTFTGLPDAPTNEDIDDLISNLEKDNRVGFGVRIQPIYVAVQIPKKAYDYENDTYTTSELFTLSFEVNSRTEGNLSLPKDVFDLVWNGNENYIGQTVSGDFNINMFSAVEVAIGAATDVYKSFDRKIRVGGRLKYLNGIVGIYTEDGAGNLNFTTAADASSITITPDYTLNTAGFTGADNEFEAANGTGFGIDLGGSLYYGERWTFSASLLDLGAINFSSAVKNYNSSDSSAVFDGIEVDVDGNTDEGIFDELERNLEGTETQNAFAMPLPTRIVLEAQYTLPQGLENEHRFFATYTQGLRDLGMATTRPLITLAYVYAVGDRLNIGAVPTFGGYNSASLGSFISYKAGIFKAGFGTSNLFSLLSGAQSGRHVDLSLNLGLTF